MTKWMDPMGRTPVPFWGWVGSETRKANRGGEGERERERGTYTHTHTKRGSRERERELAVVPSGI